MRAQRGEEQLRALAGRQCDLASFWREASAVVAELIPHYAGPCWFSLDPDNHLLTSHFHEGLAEYPEEWLQAEYLDDDVNQLLDVVRSETGISTLHELTGGDPTGTPRWQTNIAMGGDQELLLRLRTGSGEVWGALGLYRELGRPLFDAEEKRFLQAVSTSLAEGARKALVFGGAVEPDWPADGVGLVLVGADGEIESMTAAAARWLDTLAGEAPVDPTPVLAVARAAVGGQDARSRLRVPGGPWLALSASRMLGSEAVAVLIEPARPARVFDLVMSAHGLTSRERELVALVLEGQSTAVIAATLSISPYTVQEHLKSVFEKLGVRSRRELVAQAFFTHYAPRFRDNERRTQVGAPMRPNPMPEMQK